MISIAMRTRVRIFASPARLLIDFALGLMGATARSNLDVFTRLKAENDRYGVHYPLTRFWPD